MTDLKVVALGDCVRPVKTWNPLKVAGEDEFTYIDLSAVDQERKQIVEARNVACAEAPSRARQLVEAGDVLVSTVRPNLNGVARVGVEHHGATASTGFCVLRPAADTLDGGYAFQWVKSPSFVADMVSKATGASYPAVSDRIIFESRLPLPPLPEQRRIAAILDQADALRAKRREALAQLDSLTQSIFIDMFGDPGNPKGWDLVSLPEATDFQEGPGIMAKDFRQEGVPLVRLAGLDGANVSLRGCNFVEPDMFARKWAHFALNEGDILILTSATFGNPAVVGKEAAGAIFYTGIIRFKPKPSGLDAVYLRHFLASTWFMRQATALASGAVIKHFGPTHLKQMTIPVPPLPLQRQFAQRAAQVELLRRPFVQAAGESDRLFASLQHRAFAGQLA